MDEYNVYEIEWTTESGGNVRIVGDEAVIKEDVDDPYDVAWADYYCLGNITATFVREATEAEIANYGT